MASLGYKRYKWGNIEPEEGAYRWDIDSDIKEWVEAGKDFAFGLMCVNAFN